MAYYLDLFSPETYEAFSRSDRSISGFRTRHQGIASRIQPGDKLICYMTKLSRWIGILEVQSESYKDATPLFYQEDDPFVIRFKVKPLVWLSKENAVPIWEEHVWNKLSFVRIYDRKKSQTWTGKLRTSLTQLDDTDGAFLEELLRAQVNHGQVYPVDEREYGKLMTHQVRGVDKVVRVSVPEDTAHEDEVIHRPTEARESIKMQALLADIGAKMGMRIWIPRGDRAAVLSECKSPNPPLLDILPLNYDETTLKTIEQIDVLWLRGRAITRAFEIEHTTSIYSGILRMADLMALQPNMDIKLHIVAHSSEEIRYFRNSDAPCSRYWSEAPSTRDAPTSLMTGCSK